MKLNKLSMGGSVTKILRKVRVDFWYKKKKYGTKVYKSNFFALKINQKVNNPRAL